MDNATILNLLLTMYSELKKRDFELDGQLKKEFDLAIQFLDDDRNAANLLYREIMDNTDIMHSALVDKLIPAMNDFNKAHGNLFDLLKWGKEKELANLDDQD